MDSVDTVDVAEFESYILLCREGGEGRPTVDKQSVEIRLKLYGLGKQGKIGNNNEEKPGIFSPIERKKWGAWDALRGKDQTDAKREFIALAKMILGK